MRSRGWVRSAGVVLYAYAAVSLAAAVAAFFSAVGAYRDGTDPSPPAEELRESYGVVVAFLLVGMAIAATVASVMGVLLATFLRRESRVAIWLTLVLGGIPAVFCAITGVGALADGQTGTGLFALGLAGLLAVPVGMVAPAAFSPGESARS